MDLWPAFFLEKTKDNSWTLRLKTTASELYSSGEAMHHSGGAASETQLIYGTAIQQTLADIRSPWCFAVVGLGLGYIEMQIAIACVQQKIHPSQVQILSFESESQLKDTFKNWILDSSPNSIFRDTNTIYEDVLRSLLSAASLEPLGLAGSIKEWLKTLLLLNRLHLEPELNQAYLTHMPHALIHGWMYDAFSSKTSPYLWEEDFLTQLLIQHSAEKCIFSTYACTGALKRALKKANFRLHLKDGFQGKRQSTMAFR